ncbi:MAG: serine/threonine-protein phosphatase [Bryobacterales bacterium]|nr:serine/threonine-protein phosphatase [Bryobacterales bacterium]
MLLLFLLLTAITPAFGQTGARFHRGDDLRWADPAFDDSGWELVASGRWLRLEDFQTNRLWIRTRVVVPSGEQAGIVVRWCACEFYLNGKLVGSTADLDSPRPKAGPLTQTLAFPRDTPAGPALFAIRHYLPPGNDLFGRTWQFFTALQVLPVSSLATGYYEHRTGQVGLRVASILLLILVGVMSALAGHGFDRLAILICAYLASSALSVYLNMDGGTDWFVANLWSRVISTAQPVMVLAVGAMLAGVRIRVWWFGTFTAAWVLVRAVYLANTLNATPFAWTPTLVVSYLFIFAVGVGISMVLLFAGWKQPRAARALLILTVLVQVLTMTGRLSLPFAPLAMGIPVQGGLLAWDQVARLLFGLLAGVFVIRRSRERRTEELRMRGELQAARTVQSILLGQAMPAGVEAVYVPANEVGGDFYYAAETPQGTLVLVGDVSGKGLQAAMTVSAMVGTLRTVMAWEPDAVLSQLNRAALGSPGFVTCCCLLVREHEVLVANAGHPAPYFDGVECVAESGLPLGVSADASWEPSTHPRPSVITMVSDGVLEATNPNGELFGFDRALAISRKPPKEIAEAAQAWGQEDDITVVTVR